MLENIANFFTWYYLVKVRNYAKKIQDQFSYSMNKSNTLDMVKYFKTPLYQDTSSFGKNMSMFIRFWWIGIGTIYSVLTIIPKVLILILLIILPVIPVFQLINLLI